MILTSSVPDGDGADAHAPGPVTAGPARTSPAEIDAFPVGHGGMPPHCPLCAGALEPVPGMPGHARHRSARVAARCVLTTRQCQPDELAVRGLRDVRVAARHRARFVEQWARHYALVRRVWPAFTIGRFTTVLACADVQDLWSYPSLREDDLAAVLLALAGFMRVPDERGPDDPEPADDGVRWVRFWFEASMRDVGDLWTAGADAPRFFRVDYRGTRATLFPTGAQVLAWQPIGGMRDAWTQHDAAPSAEITRSDQAAFARFVAREPGQDGTLHGR
ncbi:hypothetical protein [Burkholderia anthina]|uniref:hypothetical protein n=1 Tax=Burkholderia anthina TaxID=179879 RepID=UPI00158BA224|nr:hypothetical protein [Burkholderia anthina]